MTGRHVDATKAPLNMLMMTELAPDSARGRGGADESHAQDEEIFAQDGHVEDIIAIDKTTYVELRFTLMTFYHGELKEFILLSPQIRERPWNS